MSDLEKYIEHLEFIANEIRVSIKDFGESDSINRSHLNRADHEAMKAKAFMRKLNRQPMNN